MKRKHKYILLAKYNYQVPKIIAFQEPNFTPQQNNRKTRNITYEWLVNVNVNVNVNINVNAAIG
jgi:hypothetical protein